MRMRRWTAWAVTLILAGSLAPAAAARADNPIVQTIYTADPAPLVYNGRVYLYTGHDEDGSTYFTMKEWRVYSSADMVNWTDHGSPMNLATFSWASADAWAGQAIYRNGKFYPQRSRRRSSPPRSSRGRARRSRARAPTRRRKSISRASVSTSSCLASSRMATRATTFLRRSTDWARRTRSSSRSRRVVRPAPRTRSSNR